MRKEDEVGGEQRREGSFFIGSTVIEGNFGYYIKTNIPKIYILLCINKPIEMNIFVDIILAIIKKISFSLNNSKGLERNLEV